MANTDEKDTSELVDMLSNIDTKIDSMAQNTETVDLVKDYLSECKTLLEGEHEFTKDEFASQLNAFEKNIQLLGDALSHETEKYKNIVTQNLEEIRGYIKENLSATEKSFGKAQDGSEKRLVEKLDGLENIHKSFESSLFDVNINVQSILKTLMTMDPTDQNDIIKRELENIYLSTNAILSSLQIYDQKNDELHNVLMAFTENNNIESVTSRVDEILSQAEAITKQIASTKDNFKKLSQKVDERSDQIVEALGEVKEAVASIDFSSPDCSAEVLKGLKELQKTIESKNFDFQDTSGNVVNILGELKTEIKAAIDDKTFDAPDNSKVLDAIKDVKNAVEGVEFPNDSAEVLAAISEIRDTIGGISFDIPDNSEVLKAVKNIEKSIEDIEFPNDSAQVLASLGEIKDTIGAISFEAPDNSETVISAIEDIKAAIENKTFDLPDNSEKVLKKLTEIKKALDNKSFELETPEIFANILSALAGLKSSFESVEAPVIDITPIEEKLEKVVSQTDAKIENSLKEINAVKAELSAIVDEVKNSGINIDEKITEVIKVIENVSTGVKIAGDRVSVQGSPTIDLSAVEEQLEKLLLEVGSIRADYEIDEQDEQARDMRFRSVLEEKIETIKQEVSLIGTDLIEALEEKHSGFKGEVLDTLNAKLDDFTQINATGEQFGELSDNLCALHQKVDAIILSEPEEDAHFEELADNLLALHQKIDAFVLCEDDDLNEQLDELRNLLEGQKDYISELIPAEMLTKVETFEALKDVKESILNALKNADDSKDIKGFVEEKTDEINRTLAAVTDRLERIASNEENDYSYTLQDVESDIAKLRIVLNNISETDTSGSIEQLSENINKISASMEDLSSNLTQEQIYELKDLFEKLNDDILSISSRTNKLLLNSDESYQALSDGLTKFSSVIYNLEERINVLDNREFNERVEKKMDALNAVVTSNANADKVFHQVLSYLGEWVDDASEKLNEISERVAALELDKKYEEQQNRMDRLEMKLEKVLALLEDEDSGKVAKKVDAVEKQMKKLNQNVEKLTAYVE